jgi:regulator of replication initiation timing
VPIQIDANQTLMLLGLKTLELEQLRAQADSVVNEYNRIKEENEELKKKLEKSDG